MVAEVKFDSIQEFWVQVSVHCALLHWCSPSDRYFLAKISLRVTADLLFNLGIIWRRFTQYRFKTAKLRCNITFYELIYCVREAEPPKKQEELLPVNNSAP